MARALHANVPVINKHRDRSNELLYVAIGLLAGVLPGIAIAIYYAMGPHGTHLMVKPFAKEIKEATQPGDVAKPTPKK